MTWRLVAMGYLTTLDREGGYDADVTDAVATLQADADLTLPVFRHAPKETA